MSPRDRRGAERHEHAERVALLTQWGTVTGALADLSCTGALVRLRDGLVPVAGDEVDVRLIDGRHFCGSVAWTGDEWIGIEFDQPLPSIDDILWVEQRGPGWFRAAALPR